MQTKKEKLKGSRIENIAFCDNHPDMGRLQVRLVIKQEHSFGPDFNTYPDTVRGHVLFGIVLGRRG